MKKFVTFLVVITMVLAGCGSANNSQNIDPQSENVTAQDNVKASGKYNIEFISAQSSNPFFLTINAGAQDEAKKLGVNVTFVAPATNDMQGQTSVVQAALTTKPDFVIIAPVDSTGMIEPLREINKENIPVITVDRDVNDKSVRLGTIISDNKAGGRLAAETLNELLGGSGNVAYLGFTPGIQSIDDRKTGWDKGLSNYTGLNLTGEAYETSDLQALTAKANALITKDPELKGIFASFTNAVLAASTAIKSADKVGEIKVVGFDASPDEIQALKDGSVAALIAQEAYTMGQLAVRYAVEYLDNGETPPDVTHTEYVVITAENMNDPEITPYIYRSAK